MKKCFIALMCFFSCVAFSKEKTVCLNMIVKNESSVIERCLESVRPIIDYWVIVDTGSTDGTQAVIKKYMKDMPGELYERPWINFGHNRNEALQLAKGKADYIFFIDADEKLVYEKNFKKPLLDKDFYYVNTSFAGMSYKRVLLIKDALDWKWKGVLHEYLDSSQACNSDTLYGVTNLVYTDGARSKDPDKYKKDARILEEALVKEPNNTRYVFYLAQSYKDAGDYTKSIEYYQKRVDMGGWPEEIFWSMLQVAELKKCLKESPESFIAAFSKAYSFRPSRIEPLYYLANYYRTKEDYSSGYVLAKMASKLPIPNDLLFVQKWMHDYGALIELSVCAYWIEKYEESAEACLKILQNQDLPKEVEECAKRNLGFANSKILEETIKKSANPKPAA